MRERTGFLVPRGTLPFLLIPAVSVITPLVSIPAITRHLGVNGWATIAVAQSIGVFAGLLINHGWGIVGAARIAGHPFELQQRLLRLYWASALIVACVVTPAAAGLAYVLAPTGSELPSAAIASTFAIWGITPIWYFLGRRQPLLIASYDTFPRLAGAAAAALTLPLFPNISTYVVLNLLAMTPAILVSMWRTSGFPRVAWATGALESIRHNAGLTLSRMTAGLFVSFSIPLVAFANPGAVPVFAGLDRMRSLATAGLLAVANMFQSTLGRATEPGFPRRLRIAMCFMAASGFAAGLILAVTLPSLDALLFSGVVHITPLASTTLGTTVLFVGLGATLTFHSLAPRGRTKAITQSGVIGGLVGAPAVLVLAHTWGAEGAMIGVMCTEALVVVTLLRGNLKEG